MCIVGNQSYVIIEFSPVMIGTTAQQLKKSLMVVNEEVGLEDEEEKIQLSGGDNHNNITLFSGK